jgi:medium-chain acyl-[acyl-carrier-protein] hydrolase
MPETDTLSFESPFVRRARRPDPRHRLFCFPHAGAGAATYAPWPSLLPNDIEVVAIQLPGREDRLGEPAFTDAAALIRPMVQVLRPYLRLPFSLFGHSGGALFAFELARALRARLGREPARLFVSGQPAPDLVDQLPVLHTLADADFVRAVRDLGGTAPAVADDPQLLDVVLPALRADFGLWERYRFTPGPRLSAPITAFAGNRDTRAPVDTVAAWQRHTDGAFTLTTFDGDHFFVRDRRAELAAEIGGALC